MSSSVFFTVQKPNGFFQRNAAAEYGICQQHLFILPNLLFQFSFLLNAFRYGVPPHAGLAYGLDRVVMMMLGLDSIRDVIAFPKVKDSSDLMTQAPGQVSEKQLEELGIMFRQQKED